MKLIKQNHVKYGLIMTGIIILMLAFMELSGQYKNYLPGQSPIEMFVIVVMPAIIWFLGIKSKKKTQNGKLTFRQGLLEGIKISVVFGITSPFVFAAYYLLVNPGIVDYVRDAYGLTNSSFGTVVIADMLAQLLASLFFGTIYAAIISFFLKSK